MAETYHIYDWRSLPLQTAASLASGLRAESRVQVAAAGLQSGYRFGDYLLAVIADGVQFIRWTKTKAAEKGQNRPESIVMKMTGREKREKKEDAATFGTADEFCKERNRLLGK